MEVDGDEGSGGEDDEEYEIEAILDAKRGPFPDGRMGYLVKWKGYGEEENSWVDEEDAGNAHALIAEYWKSNPNKKKAPRKSTEAKTPRRPRTSTVDETSDAGSTAAPKKRGRKSQAKADSDLENSKGMDVDENRDEPQIGDMSQHMKMASWEDIVSTVDTIERETDGSLTVYFTLKTSERVKEDARICAERFPQKLILFYEGNLRWRTNDENEVGEA
ncbi:hypothetical protein L208DRAFT_1256403 [Tricholoma matsutake]|nr:hypothetical protein L208DRAFT_1256403 [Tricholoma matsutake 945]